MTVRQFVVASLVLVSCATVPTPAPCGQRGFSCRGRQPAEPIKLRELPDSQTLVYSLTSGVDPEQVAHALCEQVLSPFGSASVIGHAVSVQDSVGAQEAARELLRESSTGPTSSKVKPQGQLKCGSGSFNCRGRQAEDPSKVRQVAGPVTLVYPIVTGLPPEQVAQTICEQVLSPFGSVSVLSKAVSVEDAPDVQERVRQLFLNVDRAPAPEP